MYELLAVSVHTTFIPIRVVKDRFKIVQMTSYEGAREENECV